MFKYFGILIISFLFLGFTYPKDVEILLYQNFEDSLEKLYLTYDLDNGSKNEHFDLSETPYKLHININEPQIAYLTAVFKAPNGEARNKFVKISLFIEPGKISITAKNDLKTAGITGSKSQLSYKVLETMLEPYNTKTGEFRSKLNEFRKEKNEKQISLTEAEIEKLAHSVKENVYYNYLLEYPSSPVSLYVLKQYAGYDFDAEKVGQLFSKLTSESQLSPGGKKFKEQIEKLRNTSVGMMAPNFTQNDTLGKPVSLSDFRGKYVLIDFWASWCGPCRAENPNLVKAFASFKNKSFTVLGVSLGRPDKKEAWLEAIQKDELTWTQVSDLKYWDNDVAKQYGIRAIPQNFLIDPQGKIVAKNIKGEVLTKTLAQLIK